MPQRISLLTRSGARPLTMADLKRVSYLTLPGEAAPEPPRNVASALDDDPLPFLFPPKASAPPVETIPTVSLANPFLNRQQVAAILSAQTPRSDELLAYEHNLTDASDHEQEAATETGDLAGSFPSEAAPSLLTGKAVRRAAGAAPRRHKPRSNIINSPDQGLDWFLGGNGEDAFFGPDAMAYIINRIDLSYVKNFVLNVARSDVQDCEHAPTDINVDTSIWENVKLENDGYSNEEFYLVGHSVDIRYSAACQITKSPLVPPSSPGVGFNSSTCCNIHAHCRIKVEIHKLYTFDDGTVFGKDPPGIKYLGKTYNIYGSMNFSADSDFKRCDGGH